MNQNLSAALPAAVIVMLVAVFAWRTHDRHIAAFAKAYEVPITPETAGPLRATIRRSRRIRWTCGAVALVVYVIAHTDDNFGFWGSLGAVAIGFGVGSIIDELSRPHVAQRSGAAASLNQRSIRTYVERWVLALLGLLIVVVAIEGWRALVIQQPPSSWAPAWSTLQIGGVLAIAALSMVIGVVALNKIAQHSAPADSVDMQMLRHGIRVAGALSVVGAMLVVLGAVGFAMTAFTVGAREPKPLNWLHTTALIVCGLGFYTGLVLSIKALPSGRWARDLPEIPDTSTPNASAA